MKNKNVYRIRHSVTGLYKKAGSYSAWGVRGKIWNGSGPIKLHLNQYAQIGRDGSFTYPGDMQYWIIEEIEIKEEIITRQPALDIMADKAKKIRDKVEAAQRERKEQDIKKQEALAKLSSADRKALGLYYDT